MSITVGTQIGPYQVTSPLGEGGMGVVFRARDTRLQRDVAIKLLPDHFADDSDRLSRFQREAQVLASMNHPNIAQIYGLEQGGASTCIVMELVDGETLAQKIERGPIPIELATPIVNQIIDGLEAAHERNVVHRDLKPANIKLTRDGQVKVLDFGLAKPLGDDDSQIALSHSPTKVSGSMAGIVLGTAAYMSPEQAKGKVVDARTDIWAFGCVLYEMLTGKQAFPGETATEIIARVLERDPDWRQLPPDTGHSIRLLLETLLAKDPKRRLRSIGDARVLLNARVRPDLAPPATAAHRKERHAWIVSAVLAIGLIAALVPTTLNLTRKPAEASVIQFEIPVPLVSNNSSAVSISPDGQRIAYSAVFDGKKAIWIRPLSALTPQVLSGTDNGDSPLWSPDSRSLVFVADGKLKKVDTAGGPVTTIGSDISFCGTWNSDGVILCSGGAESYLVRISAAGGEPTRLAIADATRGEFAYYASQFLPDGRNFLYGSISPGSQSLNTTLYASTLDSTQKVKILDLPLAAYDGVVRYVAPGYLLYIRNGNLMAQSFDVKALKVTGDPVVVAGNAGPFTASDQVLVYQKIAPGTPAVGVQQLTWFDRKGSAIGKVAEPAQYPAEIEISPDGHRAAASISGTSSDLWLIDLDRGIPSRFTFDGSINNSPVWAPDGNRIIFASSRGGGIVPSKIFQKAATGAGTDDLLYAFPDLNNAIYMEGWSRDGQYVVFEKTKISNLTIDLWVLPLSGDKEPRAYLESPFNKVQAKLSPDGHLLAYTTNESGMYQVVVQPFPNPSLGKWQVTANGGMEPRWRKDGSELYYLGLDGKLMAVPILSTSPFSVGEPMALFQTPLTVPATIPFPTRYDVSADGKRFLMPGPVNPPSAEAANAPKPPLVVVLNWTNLLKKK